MDARTVIRVHQGVASTRQLLDAGIREWGLRASVARGEVVRIRQGWYAETGSDPVLTRAFRVGGRLTCASALAHDFWVMNDHRLHVAVRKDRTQLRSSRDHTRRLGTDPSRIRIHWSDDADGTGFIVDVITALRHYAHCASPEYFAATAESVMHLAPQIADRVPLLAPLIPRSHRPALALVDGVCESGTETLFHLRMTAATEVPIRRQVPMGGVGDVDFVFGSRLVVEIDGAAFHDTPDQFERDRARDALLSAQGYRCLRYSHRQVTSAWPTVERAVLAALARGDAT